MEEKEIKNESGNILTGQAGMKVTGWREVVWAGMKRYAVKGCWPAGAEAWRGVFAGREAPHIFPVSMLTNFGILDI